MSEGVEFVAGIKDESSGPANDAIGAIDRLTKAIRDNEVALKEHGAAHKGMADGLREVGKGAHEGKGFLGEFSGALVPQIALAELAAEGVKKLGEAILEGGKFAVEAAEFKENTILAYETVQGTAAEGEKTFDMIDKLARTNHIPAEKAHGLASELMLQGLQDQKELADTVAAVGALQRTGQEAGANKLQKIVETSLTSEKFQVSAKQLRGTGIQINELYADIADRLHVGQDQVKGLMKAGKVDVDVGVAALDDAVNKGNIGKLAAQKYGVPDALVDIKNNLRSIFQGTDASPITNALKGIADGLQEGSAGGKELESTMSSLIELSGQLIGLAGNIGGAFSETIQGIKHAGDAVLDELDKLAKPFRGDADKSAQDDVDKRLHKELMVAKERADLQDLFDQEKPGAQAFKGASPNLNDPIEKARAEAQERARHLGEDVSNGIAEGIRGNKHVVRDAVVDVTGGVVETGKKELDSHSPSRKMMQLGRDATEGFTMGLDAGSDDAHAAMDFSAEAPSVKPSTGGGSGVTVLLGGVTFQISGVEKAEEILPIVESQVTDMFERIALELGG